LKEINFYESGRARRQNPSKKEENEADLEEKVTKFEEKVNKLLEKRNNYTSFSLSPTHFFVIAKSKEHAKQ